MGNAASEAAGTVAPRLAEKVAAIFESGRGRTLLMGLLREITGEERAG